MITGFLAGLVFNSVNNDTTVDPKVVVEIIQNLDYIYSRIITAMLTAFGLVGILTPLLSYFLQKKWFKEDKEILTKSLVKHEAEIERRLQEKMKEMQEAYDREVGKAKDNFVNAIREEKRRGERIYAGLRASEGQTSLDQNRLVEAAERFLQAAGHAYREHLEEAIIVNIEKTMEILRKGGKAVFQGKLHPIINKAKRYNQIFEENDAGCPFDLSRQIAKASDLKVLAEDLNKP